MFTEKQQEQILDLIRDCGRLMLTAHGMSTVDAEVHFKPGAGNFVTDYDLAVQTKLIEGLSVIVPGARFFAEEKENSPALLKDSYCFIIDPIDGTTNFMHDMKASVISVALFYDERPVFGAVYDPYGGELFHAVAGKGAWCNGQPIRVSDRPMEEALVEFGSSPYDRQVLAKRSFAIAAALFDKCVDIRRSGSAALDLCFIAAGRAEIFFEARLSPWDYAAGLIIVNEAGGKLTTFSGEPVSLSAPSEVLCTSAVLYQAVKCEIEAVLHQ